MATKKRKNSYRNKTKRNSLGRLSIFAISFAVVGGIAFLVSSYAASPYINDPDNIHHAQCVQDTPNKTNVLPGGTITAVVQIKNTGSSTFASSFGGHLLELNNDTFTNYWQPNRFSLSGDVPPGGTATFNLSVKAPSTPGTYPFGWAIGVGASGAVPYGCSGVSIKVMNPPTVSLSVNGQNQNVSITKGGSLTLNWTTTNGATSCTASGSWSGAKAIGGGSENRFGDAGSSGQKVYNLTCNNQVGSASISRTVTVNDPPPQTQNPSNPSKPGGSSPKPAVPAVPTATEDKTPPGVPSNFTASFNESVIDLNWSDSEDNTGLKGYTLERSTDNTNWQLLTKDPITATSYSDAEVAFSTTYQYRLRAIDLAGNASGYASLVTQAGSFEPNGKPDQELTITSDDGLLSVTIPAGALAQEALCALRESSNLAPTLDGYASVTGPYELLCKQRDGTRVSSFAVSPTATVKLDASAAKKYKQIRVYGHNGEWKPLTAGETANTYVLGDTTDIAVLGQKKTTPLWAKILITLVVIIAIIGGGIGGLRLFYTIRTRKNLQQKANDYYNKEHGY